MGTTTGANGQFTMSAPSNGTLVFSFVGYETSEIPVGGKTRIDVTLREAVSNLEEVVVEQVQQDIGQSGQEVQLQTVKIGQQA